MKRVHTLHTMGASSIETCKITQLQNKIKPLRLTTKDKVQLQIRNYKDKTLLFVTKFGSSSTKAGMW